MQKQEATILSAELSGFQSLAESLTPEEITPLMKEVHALVENTARLHQGKINRYTGDTFLIVFNTSKTAAKNAIDSAFELKDQLISLTREKKPDLPFKLKFGIATGGIIITDIGDEQKQQTLMGEAVNHANRICQFAEEGQILADEKTLEGLMNDFELQKLEPIPLKGGVETLPIFELTGKKRKKLDLKTKSERKIISEMVGRSREAKQLEGLIRNLIAGKGSIVNIVGKAGIGKSRLVEELKVQPLIEKVLLLEGRAVSTGQNLSFHPITNLIKNWAGITEDDLPSASSEKLYQGIKRNTPEQADEIYAFMATMMGLPLEGKYKERVKGIEGEALEKLILKNLRDLIIAATKDKPRIYLIEDMHWADSSSLTLFESLYKLSQKYPVMFINVMRPGYKETGDYILKYLVDNFPGDHTTININPLEEKESGNLIKNLLRKATLPEDIHNIIIRKTEGNPFFIEEIIRSFIDEGIVEIKEGNFVFTEKINDVNIPETINEAILSRVDKLDEKTRELLNTASVMGRNFYYKVLEEATDTIEELDDRLSYLTEVQLISETKKKQEVEYLFKHALAQQLTYDAMMQQSRKDTHLKIAHSIEKIFATNINEYYSTLAYHYEKAENKEKAEEYLIKAGDEAVKSGASSEALQFYQSALNLITESKKIDNPDNSIRDLEIKLAKTMHAVGRNYESMIKFEEILYKYFKFRFPNGDRNIWFQGIVAVAQVIFMINNKRLFFNRKPPKDFDLFTRTANAWGYSIVHHNPRHYALKTPVLLRYIAKYDLRKSIPALTAYTNAISIFNFGGISIKAAQKGIDFVRENGIEKDPYGYVCFNAINRVHDYYVGNWEMPANAQDVYSKSLSMGEAWNATTFAFYSGMCSLAKGDYLLYRDMLDKMQEIYETLDYEYSYILRMRLLAVGYADFGKFNEAIPKMEEDLDKIEKTSAPAILLIIYLYLANSYLFADNYKKGKIILEKSEDLIETNKRIPIYITAYLKVKILFLLFEVTQMDENGRRTKLKAINNLCNELIQKSKKVIAIKSEAYLLKAKFLWVQNKNNSALKNFQLAITAGEKYDTTISLSRAYFETGKFLSDPNNKYNELNGHNASHYLEKAKAMFEEMDLQWDMEAYNKFMENKDF
ncbi:AAA family ATPase [Desulfosarcina sp.]|nr:AAA family ATPase [Desulfosarcina sp.]